MRKLIIPSFIEIMLLVIIIAILVFATFNPVYRDIAKIGILITICYWALLVIFGLLIPCMRHRFSLAFDFNPKENRLGYPITVSLESRGGFICGNPIIVKSQVIDTAAFKEKGAVAETRRLFRENFVEFSVLWPSSKPYKNKKKFASEDKPEIGAVRLNIKKCSGSSAIVFTSAGRQNCCLVYKTKMGMPVTTAPLTEEDTPAAFLQISPAETLYQLRIINILYGLTLLIVSFLLWNMLGLLW